MEVEENQSEPQGDGQDDEEFDPSKATDKKLKKKKIYKQAKRGGSKSKKQPQAEFAQNVSSENPIVKIEPGLPNE